MAYFSDVWNKCVDTVNGVLRVVIASAMAGEDLVNNVLKVEQRFTASAELNGGTNTVIKSSPGFIHSIIIAANATGAATVILRDSATAGSGTIIKTFYVIANAAGQNFSIPLNVATGTGIEVDFSGKADTIGITITYR